MQERSLMVCASSREEGIVLVKRGFGKQRKWKKIIYPLPTAKITGRYKNLESSLPLLYLQYVKI